MPDLRTKSAPFDDRLTGDQCEHDQSFHAADYLDQGRFARERESGHFSNGLHWQLLAAAGLLGGSAAIMANQDPIQRRRFLRILGLGGAATALTLANPFSANEAWAAPPQLAANVLPVEIIQRGGAQFPFWLRYPGKFPNGTVAAAAQQWGPQNNPIALPPQVQGSAVPNGYGMVPVNPSDPNSLLVNFVQKFGDRMMVIVSNHGTNNHEAGRRRAVQGSAADLFPSSNALFAAQNGGNATMPFITNTSPAYEGGVISPTDLKNPDGLLKLAFPNLANPNDPNSAIFVPSVDTLLMNTRVQALQAIAADPLATPGMRKHAQFRLAAEGAREEIAQILNFIQAQNNQGMSNLVSTARIAMAGKSNGLVSAAFLSDGKGYDTHGQMDGAQQMNNAQDLMEAINLIMHHGANNTDSQGAAAPVSPLVTVKTDFGRRPVNGDASAHWVNGMTVIIGDAVKAYLDSKGVQGPINIGMVDDNLNLVGPDAQQVNIEDVIAFQRQLIGLPLVGPFAIQGITAPNAIDNLVV